MGVIFMVAGGFEQFKVNIRWTFTWHRLDGANTLISAKRKCNKSLLRSFINDPIHLGVCYFMAADTRCNPFRFAFFPCLDVCCRKC